MTIIRDTVSIAIHDVCRYPVVTYIRAVPRLWEETIDAHRRAVAEAILDITASLVATNGLRSVTMSQVAEETGIGRATLYKNFPDIESILVAWHERQVASHLEQLAALAEQSGSAAEKLEAVLDAYAGIRQAHHDTEIAALVHRGPHATRAHEHLRAFIRAMVEEGARAGDLRNGVAPDELASYCLHALAAARSLPSRAAARRLVAVTLAGLRPPPT